MSRQSPGPNGFNNLTPGFTSLMGTTIMTVRHLHHDHPVHHDHYHHAVDHDHHDHPVDDDHHDHDDDNDDVQGW